MTSRGLLFLVSAVIFAVLAGLNLYRLLVGFPITIGGYTVGATVSFFMMCAFAAISMMLLREVRR